MTDVVNDQGIYTVEKNTRNLSLRINVSIYKILVVMGVRVLDLIHRVLFHQLNFMIRARDVIVPCVGRQKLVYHLCVGGQSPLRGAITRAIHAGDKILTNHAGNRVF